MPRSLDPVAEASSLRRRNITYFPVVPGRVEFAFEVRRRMLAEKPGILAIELPPSLSESYLHAIGRFPEISILEFPDPIDSEQKIHVTIEPTDPFVEALRTALELGIEVQFIEPEFGDQPHLGDLYPDPYGVTLKGLECYLDAYRLEQRPQTDEVLDHAQAMAYRLQGTDPARQVLAVVSLNLLDALLDAMEVPQGAPARPRLRAIDAGIFQAHPECLAEITFEFPFLIDRYEHLRHSAELLDRHQIQRDLLAEAEVCLFRVTGERLETWQRLQLSKFAFNLAHLTGDLIPDLVDLTVAARGIAGDHYASEVWRTINQYANQRENSDLPVLRLLSEEIWCRSRRVRLRRRRASRPARLGARVGTVVAFDHEGVEAAGIVEGHIASYEGGVFVSNSDEPLGDLWADSRYDTAATPAERLLLAAIDLSANGAKVRYIAAKPPRRLIRETADHSGVRIDYVPIGSVSSAQLSEYAAYCAIGVRTARTAS